MLLCKELKYEPPESKDPLTVERKVSINNLAERIHTLVLKIDEMEQSNIELKRENLRLTREQEMNLEMRSLQAKMYN